MGSVARKAAKASLWSVLSLALILASARLHLGTEMGREAVREWLTSYISSLIVGELQIDSIDSLTPARASLRNVRVVDPSGEVVIDAEHVVVGLDLPRLLDDELYFRYGHIDGLTLRLIEGEEGTPTFIEAFNPVEPPDPDAAPSLRTTVNGLFVEGATVEGEVLGVEGLRLEDADVRWRIDAYETMKFTFHSATGRLTAPYPFEARLDRAHATIDSDPHVGTFVTAALSVGEETVPVNMRFRVPEGSPVDAPAELDLLLHPSPLDATRLAQVGQSWAETLRGPLDGYVRFSGPGERLRLRASLNTAGGPLRADGELGATAFDVRVRTPGMQLQPILDADVDLTVAGQARIHQENLGDPSSFPRVEAEVDPLEWNGFAIPSLKIAARLEPEQAILEEVTAPHVEGSMDVRGKVSFEGEVDVRVRARLRDIASDPNLRRLVPDARGGISTDLRVQLSPGPSPRIRTLGDVKLSRFRYAGVQAQTIEADANIRGPLDHPTVAVEANLVGLRYGPINLGQGALNVEGNGARYDTSLNVSPHPGQRLIARISAEQRRRGWELNSQELRFEVGDARWQGQLRGLKVGAGDDIELDEFQASHDTEQLYAAGRFSPRQGHDFSFRADDVDIGPMVRFVTGQDVRLEGRLSAQLSLGGDARLPTCSVEANLIGGQIGGIPGIASRLQARYADAQWRGDLGAQLGGQGQIRVELTAATEEWVPSTQRDFEAMDVMMSADVSNVELGLLEPLLASMPQIRGNLSGQTELRGRLGSFEVDTELSATSLIYGEFPPLTAELVGSYRETSSEQGDHDLTARLQLEDVHGPLLEIDTRMVAALSRILTADSPSADMLGLQLRRFNFLHPPRLVSQLPGPLREQIPSALHDARAVASGSLRERSDGLRGSAQIGLTYAGDLEELPCGETNSPQAIIRADIERGMTRLAITARAGTNPILEGTVQAPTPVAEWIRAATVPTLPPTQVHARLLGFPLDRVPIACEYVEGPVEAELHLADLFGAQPSGNIGIASRDFRIRRVIRGSDRGQVVLATPLLSVGFAGELLNGEVEMEGSAHAGAEQHMDFSGVVPIRWGGDVYTPEVPDDSPLTGELQFLQAPLALALAAIPNISSVSGFMDGRIQIGGTVGDPELEGSVTISDGGLTLQSLSQTLEEIRGEFELTPGRIRVANLRARDDTGVSSARGTVNMSGWAPERVQLSIEAREFPVRQEGALMGRVSGEAEVIANIGDEGADANVVADRLAIRLPDQATRSLQSLEPHPDIVILGDEHDDETDVESLYPVRVAFETTNPFWVRRNDFSAQVSTDLDIVYESPALRIGGYADIRRGTFDVVGKEFEVREGQINFDGEAELNPEIDLTAAHAVRGHENVNVILHVRDRLATPSIAFSVEGMACADRGQIVALLVSGTDCAEDLGTSGNNEANAIGDQAAGFVTGVMTGLGTLWAREQFGSRLPVISIESLDEGLTSARVRAGYQLDEFIPDSLRRIVRGIYVEGSVSVGGDEDAENRRTQDVGFLLRLQFPHNIVGEVAGYPTNDSWRVDMTWEP